jgi:hypothetical protein
MVYGRRLMLKSLDAGVNKENSEQGGGTDPQEFHFAIVTAWAGVRKTVRVKRGQALLYGVPRTTRSAPRTFSKKFIRSD